MHMDNFVPGSGDPIFHESHVNMERFINEFKKRSRYSRSLEDGKTTITNGESHYLVERITSGRKTENKKAAREVHSFLDQIFGEDEMGDKEEFEHAIKNGIFDFTTIRDEKGEILSVICSQNVDSLKSSDQMLAIWYIATKEDQQSKGFALELYQSVYETALADARNNGKGISAVVGEAVDEVEGYLNKMGRRRTYFYNQVGDLVEIPFPQPPIDASTADEKPPEEHLMIRFLDEKKECSVEEILDIIKTLFYQYIDPRYDELYDSKKEADAVKKRTKALFEEVKKKLSEAHEGKVILLSADEREEKRKELEKSGHNIIEAG